MGKKALCDAFFRTDVDNAAVSKSYDSIAAAASSTYELFVRQSAFGKAIDVLLVEAYVGSTKGSLSSLARSVAADRLGLRMSVVEGRVQNLEAVAQAAMQAMQANVRPNA